MSFLLGLLIGMGLSSKSSGRQNVGGIWLEPVGDHSTDPFATQDQQSFEPDTSRTEVLSLPRFIIKQKGV